MSLFIDVVDALSTKIKTHFVDIIETERGDQERAVRKICDVCSKYLKYGDLRYDKVENGVRILGEMSPTGNAFYMLLLAILNESLDEDLIAVKFLTEFSGSSFAGQFRTELDDFITIGKVITLKEYSLIENAGLVLIDRHSDETNVTESLANLYIRTEAKEYLPAFHRLLERAKKLYPANMHLESFNGFIYIMAKNYEQALESYNIVKDNVEKDHDNRFYHLNLATIWDSIADCYLKLGNAEKTIESCDTALSHIDHVEDSGVETTLFYKKAEALLLQGAKDDALTIVKQILEENEDDEKAQAILNTIMKHP